MKRIDKLTPEQKAQMGGWAKRWIEIGLRTGETDFETFDKYLRVVQKQRDPFEGWIRVTD